RSRILGKGSLPDAHLYSFSELAEGQQDSQWVQVRGIVRSASIDRSSWQEMALAMNVSADGGQFKVRVPVEREEDMSRWINSEILIEGVCGSLFNAERQLIGVLFYIPRLSFIKMERTAKEVPFSVLLRFSPDHITKQRVQVRGVVGYQQPGNAIFIQSQDNGLRVLTQQDTLLQVGDVVDVQGVPAVGESAPVLQDAVFHFVRHDAPPKPLEFDPGSPWERYDGLLLTMEAK